MSSIRKTAVAGTFYPDDADRLSRAVDGYLADAKPTVGDAPKAVIAPHAGYPYSGPVAAAAYARIKPARARIKRVVLLGPCHRVAVRGLALPGAEAFESPLGDVAVDKAAVDAIKDLPQVSEFPEAHAREHSLEVHIPFLQRVIDDFTLVPLVVGEAAPAEITEVLEAVWGGRETLIVVSSDLSHYLSHADARAIDARTARAIEMFDGAAIEPNGACGRFPVAGLLDIAKRRGMRIETVDVRNSGDTFGGRDKVVGYGSWLLTETRPGPARPRRFEDDTRALLERHGRFLLDLAANAVKVTVRGGKPVSPDLRTAPSGLRASGASFVTLRKSGRLRGCVGSSEARQPLIRDVVSNAVRAAAGDPRFKPVSADELTERLALSISVLSPQTPMTAADEAGLLRQLRPGVDGLVIADGARRALFLPSVWEQLPDPAAFLARLRRKAGLPGDHWSPAFQARRFMSVEITTKDLGADAASVWD